MKSLLAVVYMDIIEEPKSFQFGCDLLAELIRSEVDYVTTQVDSEVSIYISEGSLQLAQTILKRLKL